MTMIKKEDDKIEQIKAMATEDMDLSVRSYNCLKRANIHTVGDLTKKTEDDMLRVRNLGRKSLDEVIEKLKSYGLCLKETYKMLLKDVLHKFVVVYGDEYVRQYREDNETEANALLCFPYISESGELLYRVLSRIYFVDGDYYLISDDVEKEMDLPILNLYNSILFPVENKALQFKFSSIIENLMAISNKDEEILLIRKIDYLEGYRDAQYPDNYIVRLVDEKIDIVGGLRVRIKERLGNDDGKTLFIGTIANEVHFTDAYKESMNFKYNIGDEVCVWYEEKYLEIAGTTFGRMYVSIDWKDRLKSFYYKGFEIDDKEQILQSYSGSQSCVRIPYGINEIGEDAFCGDTNIIEVRIPKTVAFIRKGAFADCTNLRKVVFEKESSLFEIEEDAFSECGKLSQIEFPKGLQCIGESAFYKCISLTQVALPPNLEKIEKKAFNYCSGLEKVFLPMSLNSIGEYAFDCCDSLQKFVVDSRNTFYKAINGNLFDRSDEDAADEIYLIKYASGKTESVYTIPEKTTSIDAYAFHASNNLIQINVPSKVESIGDFAFRINTLKDIKVDEYNQKYKDIDGVLYSKNGEYLLHYPSGRTECEYRIAESIKEIAANSFFAAKHLEKVIIPQGVTTIGSDSFYFCKKMSAIELPSSIRKIYEGAFMRSGLKNCIIPDGVEVINPKVFYENEELLSVVLPSSVKYIGHHCFYGCKKLKSLIYLGTMSQWGLISKGYKYMEGCNNFQVVCLDGVINN